MINKQRVQRIRGVIYTLFFLIIFVPIILIIVLCYQMIGLVRDMSVMLAQENQPEYSQSAPAPDSSQSESHDEQGEESPPASEPATASSQAEEMPASPDPDEGLRLDDYDSYEDIGDAPQVIDGNTGQASGVGEYVQNTYSPSSYPSLAFDTLPVPLPSEQNTLYLTFDNTPSSQAWAILEVLEKHGVKATFFVWWNASMGDENLRFYSELYRAGHQIGIHSATNTETFSQIYSSCDYFLSVFNQIFDQIYAETGLKTRLYRLPGGSVTPQDPQRQAVLAEIKSELDARGFLQYDWNASAEDAVVPSLSKEQILRNIEASMTSDGQVVVLLHDGTGSSSTVEALDAFISTYKAQGFSFKPLEYDTETVSFLDNR